VWKITKRFDAVRRLRGPDQASVMAEAKLLKRKAN